MVDDILSEEILDLISGTYLVDTGKGDQTSTKSWYPRANSWDVGGLSVDFWTEECEKWFTKRRNLILSGEAQPLSGTEWRRALRMSRKSPILMTRMNNATLSYLHSPLAYSLTH
ncbi:hypothetical protein CPB84DRAFT_1689108 [Gymnopilus junonius]|uniref:Uncharacterized protein n=1 Tax=Gymnopilus junonius TaxID=109634 RepID=A0A9P5N830_GYMJU|nr:hypothetical protein CPB84DRAFT_1691082 [Gymnopilus junonius]KAF8876504.1 hypothetical protein CPB84DRAFT_1689108 [Gymnopilus junonius]